MTVLTRYVGGAVARTALVAAAILLGAVFSNRFASLVARVAAGELPGDALGALLLLKVAKVLALLLPAAYFIGALAVLGRMYRDSEVTALLACGVAPTRLYRGVVAVGLAVGAVVLWLAGWGGPMAENLAARLEREAERRAEIAALHAGRFRVSTDGRVTFYAERLSPDRRRLEEVFAEVRGDRGRMVLRARWGEQVTTPEGDRYLVLHDGVRYEGVPGRADYRVLRFAAHAVRVARPRIDPAAVARERTLPELLGGDGEARAELHWRLGLALGTPLLGMLAVPLARTDPRRGRLAPVVGGLAAYLVYFNLLLTGRNWLARGVLPPEVGLWWVHLLAVAAWLVLVGAPAWRRRV